MADKQDPENKDSNAAPEAQAKGNPPEQEEVDTSGPVDDDNAEPEAGAPEAEPFTPSPLSLIHISEPTRPY